MPVRFAGMLGLSRWPMRFAYVSGALLLMSIASFMLTRQFQHEAQLAYDANRFEASQVLLGMARIWHRGFYAAEVATIVLGVAALTLAVILERRPAATVAVEVRTFSASLTELVEMLATAESRFVATSAGLREVEEERLRNEALISQTREQAEGLRAEFRATVAAETTRSNKLAYVLFAAGIVGAVVLAIYGNHLAR
jgi:hypothetical protein